MTNGQISKSASMLLSVLQLELPVAQHAIEPPAPRLNTPCNSPDSRSRPAGWNWKSQSDLRSFRWSQATPYPFAKDEAISQFQRKQGGGESAMAPPVNSLA